MDGQDQGVSPTDLSTAEHFMIRRRSDHAAYSGDGVRRTDLEPQLILWLPGIRDPLDLAGLVLTRWHQARTAGLTNLLPPVITTPAHVLSVLLPIDAALRRGRPVTFRLARPCFPATDWCHAQ